MPQFPRESYLQELLQLERPPQTPREANPLFISSVALLRGIRPPRLNKAFTCCELFAGQGLSSSMAAAVFPEATFYALDSTAVNVAVGRDIAAQAELENVQHIHAGLDDLEQQKLPPCDFICVHEAHFLGGVEGLRRLAVFLERTLAPGGLCSISYHALPGMQEEQRLRDLLRQLVRQGQGNLESRIKSALQQVRNIYQASGILEQTPMLATLLERLQKGLSPHMARELLHPDWQPLGFLEVNDVFEAAGMRHLGQAALHYDFPSLLMSKERLEAYAPHDGTPLGEHLKGLLSVQTLRYDVFHNGAPSMSSMEHGLALAELAFARLIPSGRMVYELPTPHGMVQLERELVDPVFRALEQGAATYAQMLQALAQEQHSPELLHQIVAMLVDSGQLHPMLLMETAPLRALLLDRVLLERFILENGYSVAVTPRLGAGLQLTWETQTMRLIQQGAGEDTEAAIQVFMEQLQAYGRQLIHEGRPLEDPEEIRAQVGRMWQEFTEETSPLLDFLQGPEPKEAGELEE